MYTNPNNGSWSEVNNREQEKWCKKETRMKKSVSEHRVDCTSTKFNYPLIRVDIRLKMGYLSTKKKNKQKKERCCCWSCCLALLFSVLFSDFRLKSPHNYNRMRYTLNVRTTVVYWNTQCGTKVAAFIFHIHCRFYHHRSHFTALHFLSSDLRPVLSLALSVTVFALHIRTCLFTFQFSL